MGPIIQKYLLQYVVGELQTYLTPEKIQEALDWLLAEIGAQLTPEHLKEILTPVVAQMRVWAKSQTPNFPYDDAAVDALAVALGIP